MRRRIVLTCALLALTYLYLLGITYGFGFAAALRTPQWWIAPFHSLRAAGISWLLISHAVTLILISIPFAALVAWLYGRLSIRVALVVAVVTWTILAAPLLSESRGSSWVGMWLVETLELVIALPTCVWLLRLLPSNFRWSGP